MCAGKSDHLTGAMLCVDLYISSSPQNISANCWKHFDKETSRLPGPFLEGQAPGMPPKMVDIGFSLKQFLQMQVMHLKQTTMKIVCFN